MKALRNIAKCFRRIEKRLGHFALIIEYPNLAPAKLCSGRGVTDRILLCPFANPVRALLPPLQNTPPTAKRRNFNDSVHPTLIVRNAGTDRLTVKSNDLLDLPSAEILEQARKRRLEFPVLPPVGKVAY